MIGTSCKDCVFSHAFNSVKPCDFDLIDSIKNNRTIEVKDNYNYIPNYRCRYGLSKKTYYENKEKLDELDLVNYIKQRNLVKYYLIIDLETDTKIEELCTYINSLSIKPDFVSILTYDSDMNSLVENIKAHIRSEIRWKLHNLINKDMDHTLALKVALDTSAILDKTQFIWINRSSDMQYISNIDAVSKINYIINIEQPVCNFIGSQILSSNNFHNLWIPISTYKHIVKQISSSLADGIKQLGTTVTAYYD
jgi:hypothetical protein